MYFSFPIRRTNTIFNIKHKNAMGGNSLYFGQKLAKFYMAHIKLNLTVLI